MASRFLQNQQFSYDKYLVECSGVVNIGASGAPTLQQWTPSSGGGGSYKAAVAAGARGIKSITRNSTGNYTVVLQDSFQRLVNYEISFIGPSGTTVPLAPIATVIPSSGGTATNVNSNTSPQITFVCQSSAGTPADPASGEQMLLTFFLQNSTAY